MVTEITFDMIHTTPDSPGIYEIYTTGGIPLKVGIAEKLRSRLKKHKASLDSGLKPKPGHNRSNPKNVNSKGSILVKHFFFDTAIAPKYNLKTKKVGALFF